MSTEARERLGCLWDIAEAALREEKVHTARYFAAEVVRVAAASGTPLSDEFLSSLCPSCRVPRVVGLTTRVRLRSRRKRSPAALRSMKRRRRAQMLSFRIRSHLVITCLLCDARRRVVASHEKTKASSSRSKLSPDYIPIKRVEEASSEAIARRPKKSKAPRLLLDAKPRKRQRKK